MVPDSVLAGRLFTQSREHSLHTLASQLECKCDAILIHAVLFVGVQAHGYCSQEIVTLLLTGKAHSNVFNGEMTGMMTNDDNSDKPMKGILSRSDVGHLLLTEALNPGFIEVGSNYKHPRHPIYVVCSESHYSILFSLDIAVSDPANFPGASTPSLS